MTHYNQSLFIFNYLFFNFCKTETDYTFAETIGQPKSFGSAGDCYSKTGECPKGAFSIDLDGTGFRVRARTNWEANGTNSTIRYIHEVCIKFCLTL